jgi:hypothetical protein
MRIQLMRKLADHLDGVDVSAFREGDVFDLPRRDAQLLIAEGWAAPFVAPANTQRRAPAQDPASATDRPALSPRTLEQLRRLREQLDTRRFEQDERRRAEDVIREELHDARARTVTHEKP